VLIKSEGKKIKEPLEKNKKDIRLKTLKANSYHTKIINDDKVDTIDIPSKQVKITELPKPKEENITTDENIETKNNKFNIVEERMKQIKSELNQSYKSLEDKNKELITMKKELIEKQKLIQQKEEELEHAIIKSQKKDTEIDLIREKIDNIIRKTNYD
jgi:hypothetical protein